MLTAEDLVEGLRRTNIKRGDTIMVHTSYKSLGGVVGGAETVIDALLKLVGDKGSVLFSTFNFQSWTESHYFDIKETPSKMGMITEMARLRPEARRTPHPIYSFAALGARAQEFAECDDREAYGPRSVFARFHELNGKILSIGLDFNNTFSIHHYVEYNVGCDYRRTKDFSGIYVGADRKPRLETYSMYVRKDDRVKTMITPAMNELLEKGFIREFEVGLAKVHTADAQTFFEEMAKVVRQNPEKLHYLLESKA